MRRPVPLACSLASLLLPGCTDLILVGYECADPAHPCAPQDPPPPDAKPPVDAAPAPTDGALDAEPEVDAQEEDAETDAGMEDAGQDAESDAEPPLALYVQNPSFELTDGSPGAVQNVLGGSAEIEPWTRCGDLTDVLEGVRVRDDGSVTASHGETYIELGFVLTGFASLTQPLARTWRAGETRALTFDVTATGLGFDQVQLEVLGAAEMCPPRTQHEVLGEGDMFTQSAEWTPICMEITPDNDTEWLMLTATTTALVSLDATSRVFIDNVRESPTCPAADENAE